MNENHIEQNLLIKGLFDKAPIAQAINDLETLQFIKINKEFTIQTGFTKEDVIGKTPIEIGAWPDMESTYKIGEKLKKDGFVKNERVSVRTKSGNILQGLYSAEIIKYKGKSCILGYSIDITETLYIDKKRRLMETAIEYSLELNTMLFTHTKEEIIQCGIDKATLISNSKIGYFHFIDISTGMITLTAWSKGTLEHCPLSDADDNSHNNHYPLKDAGIWVDCVHKKEVVIHNEYDKEPHKKGLPEGHTTVTRDMGIPIISNGIVVAVLGVGNKETSYTKLDSEMVFLIAENIWRTFTLKESQQIIEKERDKYRELFENMPNGYTHHKMIYDDGGNPKDFLFLIQNKAAIEMSFDAQGKTYNEILEGQKDELDFVQIYGEVTLTGKSKKIEQYVSRLGRWYSILAFSTEKDYFITIVGDVTELKQKEQQYKDLVELLPSAIVVYNIEDMKLVFANPAACKLIGVDNYEQIIGKLSSDFVDISCKKEVIDRIHYMIKTGNVAESQIEKFLDINGNPVDVEVTAKPITYKGVPSILVIFYDVADKITLEEQLKQAAKLEAIGLLAGGVAHDFNNILTVIRGHTELLINRSKKIPHNDIHDYVTVKLDKIDKASERAEALTKQLLAFGRKQIMTPDVINLNAVFKTEIGVLSTLIREDIEIQKHLDVELGNCYADANQVSLVMMNLILNAKDAIPEQEIGRITIETKNIFFDDDHVERKQKLISKGQYVMFAVTDDGVGMDKTTQERIFEPFFTTKELGKGVGLGLSTAYGIIKQSGGFVWVYSEIGIGTTFKVYFPRVDKKVNNGRVVNEYINDFTGNETILVVEDEKEVRELICEALKDLGYKLLCASNGIEAIEVVKNSTMKIDMMVTDVVMPKMDGRELAIHLSDFLPNMKVLYMSGYTDNTIVHRGVLDPETNFIQKPVTPTTITRKIREILDNGTY